MIGLTVRQRADFVATAGWVDVRLMEMLAGWVPTTAEMEVKLLFGAHIWDVAQHADAFGRRAHELRLPLQARREPTRPYLDLVHELGETRPTAQRVAAVYDVLLPGVRSRLISYTEQVDQLLDEPTVRIVRSAVADLDRMVHECEDLRREIPAAVLTDTTWVHAWLDRDRAVGDFVDYRVDDAA